MDIKTERLKADHEKLKELLSSNPVIRILDTVGYPPTRYEVEYKVKGMAKNQKSGKVEPQETFRVEITLTDGYPKLAPQCRAITPAFHPNIIADAICVTDYWAAGSSLSRLVIRIGELLAFQAYGLKFPLNPEAAIWTEDHVNELPTDDRDFVELLHASEGIRRASQEDIRETDVCISCGKAATDIELYVTESNYLACKECVYGCSHCHVPLSLKSAQKECDECHNSVCYKCIHRCLICSKLVCFDHMIKCEVCDLGHCKECIRECQNCNIKVCMEHSAPAQRDGEHVILCENCIRDS